MNLNPFLTFSLYWLNYTMPMWLWNDWPNRYVQITNGAEMTEKIITNLFQINVLVSSLLLGSQWFKTNIHVQTLSNYRRKSLDGGCRGGKIENFSGKCMLVWWGYATELINAVQYCSFSPYMRIYAIYFNSVTIINNIALVLTGPPINFNLQVLR